MMTVELLLICIGDFAWSHPLIKHASISLILYVEPALLLEVLHLSGGEAGSHAVHPHVDHKLLVGVQQVSQRIERLLSNWIEADINHLELLEHFKLIEEFNCSIICDATLLEAKLLELVAEGGSCGDHFGSVVLDECITHIDRELVVLHAFLEVGLYFLQEFSVKLLAGAGRGLMLRLCLRLILRLSIARRLHIGVDKLRLSIHWSCCHAHRCSWTMAHHGLRILFLKAHLLHFFNKVITSWMAKSCILVCFSYISQHLFLSSFNFQFRDNCCFSCFQLLV